MSSRSLTFMAAKYTLYSAPLESDGNLKIFVGVYMTRVGEKDIEKFLLDISGNPVDRKDIRWVNEAPALGAFTVVQN